jgi:hypothetical protein
MLKVTVTVALSVIACASVYAAEEALEFKLVVMPAEVTKLDAPNIPGQTVFANKMKGAAFFKDGRIAAKDFISVADVNKGTGLNFGYSTYQFEDGSSIMARFEIQMNGGTPGQGEYKILSGTGKYQGVSGTGRLEGVPTKFGGGANLLNGSFKLTTP